MTERYRYTEGDQITPWWLQWTQVSVELSTGQAGAEWAYAKWRGFDDWSWDEERVQGMVRGVHVLWQPRRGAGVEIPDSGRDDDVFVSIVGGPPTTTYELDGWITLGEARSAGVRVAPAPRESGELRGVE